MDDVVVADAKLEDIRGVLELHSTYHIDTISAVDRTDGFVTTRFTPETLADLIRNEHGLSVAKTGDRVVGYAAAASWQYWSSLPMFQKMESDLPRLRIANLELDRENSCQYGPVCIARERRGRGLLEALFEQSSRTMSQRYECMITFINKVNARSLSAHTRKLHLAVLGDFRFGDNEYYYLGRRIRVTSWCPEPESLLRKVES